MRNKFTKLWILVVTLCLVVSGCGSEANSRQVYMGFDKTAYTVVEEEDTHGGFHGDGSYYLILDCSADPEKALDIVSEWDPMPLSGNLALIMYGGVRDGVTYAYELAEKAHWPRIERGYYRFADEQSDDPTDDSELLGKASFNFEIAAYDTLTDRFYFFRLDT